MQLADIQRKIELRLPSARMLVLTNLMTILIAIVLQMDPSSVVWAYWLESVVIGLFAVFALWIMSGKSILSRSLRDAVSSFAVGVFFCFHYGMFHAVYAVFLYVLPWFTPDLSRFPDIAMLTLILVLSHGISFVKNTVLKPGGMANTKENRSRFMKEPYNRIIPMHIAIIVSGFVLMPLFPIAAIAGAVEGGSSLAVQLIKMSGLVVFMTIKTLADIFGHVFGPGAKEGI